MLPTQTAKPDAAEFKMGGVFARRSCVTANYCFMKESKKIYASVYPLDRKKKQNKTDCLCEDICPAISVNGFGEIGNVIYEIEDKQD